MGLQKYRAEAAELAGEPRVTVYITGEPDTWFSVSAACRYRGVTVRGYATGDDGGNIVFRHAYR